MKDRDASNAVAPMCWRALNSGTSVLYRRLTSITGSPSWIGRHVERHDDGVVVGSFHGLGDGRIRIGVDAEIDVAQIDAIVAHLPLDHLIGDLAAAITDADGGLGDLRVPQILFAEFLLGDFVVIALAHLVDGEHALFRFRVLGDHAIERLGIGNA